MLEVDYSKLLTTVLESCECDLAVPDEWRASLGARGAIPPIPNDQRRFVRHRFGDWAALEYDQTFSSIPRKHTIAQVMTRDISRCGVAFFHADQLFPGERVSLWLKAGKQSFVVQRCVQHNENCFEIGARVSDNGSESPAVKHDKSDNRSSA
jgi:hypothetical protein